MPAFGLTAGCRPAPQAPYDVPLQIVSPSLYVPGGYITHALPLYGSGYGDGMAGLSMDAPHPPYPP